MMITCPGCVPLPFHFPKFVANLLRRIIPLRGLTPNKNFSNNAMNVLLR